MPSGRREARVLADEPNQEDASVRSMGERLVMRTEGRDRVLVAPR